MKQISNDELNKLMEDFDEDETPTIKSKRKRWVTRWPDDIFQQWTRDKLINLKEQKRILNDHRL